jgi:hypothetical protein
VDVSVLANGVFQQARADQLFPGLCPILRAAAVLVITGLAPMILQSLEFIISIAGIL